MPDDQLLLHISRAEWQAVTDHMAAVKVREDVSDKRWAKLEEHMAETNRRLKRLEDYRIGQLAVGGFILFVGGLVVGVSKLVLDLIRH